MIKVLAAALTGLTAGIAVMIVVIALTGSDTPGADADVGGVATVTVPGGETGATVNTTGPGGTTPTEGETGGSTEGGGTTAGGGGSGDAGAGEAVFNAECSSCHAIQPGQASPFPSAPNLAESNLTEEQILQQIDQGGGAMPADLVQGQDASNVAAYILSTEG